MGQKVNPISLRLGINRAWDSRWFADGNYATLLHEDLRIRKFLHKKLVQKRRASLVTQLVQGLLLVKKVLTLRCCVAQFQK